MACLLELPWKWKYKFFEGGSKAVGQHGKVSKNANVYFLATMKGKYVDCYIAPWFSKRNGYSPGCKVTCTQDGDIPHNDDSVFLNILASDGIHPSVIYPPFRTLLGFPTFLYVNVAPRNNTHIPWLRSPNQSKEKKTTKKQLPQNTFKRFVRYTKSKGYREDSTLQNLRIFQTQI